jgi:hypothetical protein
MDPKFNFFGNDAAFHHLGLVVESIIKLVPDAAIITDPLQKVRLSFVELNGVCLELLEPAGNDSPVFKNLQNQNKLAHICYTVPDINRAIDQCRPHGFHCIAKPVMAVAFNRKIAWVFHPQYGLIELLESNEAT